LEAIAEDYGDMVFLVFKHVARLYNRKLLFTKNDQQRTVTNGKRYGYLDDDDRSLGAASEKPNSMWLKENFDSNDPRLHSVRHQL